MSNSESLKSIAQVDFKQLSTGVSYTPSPEKWEDQVLYFMMLDRFSDGNESNYKDNQGNITLNGTTSLFDASTDNGNAVRNDQDAYIWRESGVKWVGGNLKGLRSKLGYLQRLGVTTIWVSPLFKQVHNQDGSYHGYGIQNYFEVDPHFGTKEELKEVVKEAHAKGIYVILDIILNHTGDVFDYVVSNPVWNGQKYDVKGFRNSQNEVCIPFRNYDIDNPASSDENDAVWPVEFQNPNTFTQKGSIQSWDYFPEYLEGDFCSLKDVDLGNDYDIERQYNDSINSGQTTNIDFGRFVPSEALKNLCEVYKYWIAYADLDGYRLDTVKHMGVCPTRFFISAIHEFAQSIGKENFYLIGEITGGRTRAYCTLEVTGLDAALGIDNIQDGIEGVTKGFRSPSDYFGLFRNSAEFNKDSHTWFNNKVVTMIDDHDQVRRGNQKARYCANGGNKLVLNALALNLNTLGIPCIYYGTEQYFDGQGDSDRYIRETMFGGKFGAFRSKDRHFFTENNHVYTELIKIIAIRKQKKALRRGRQYLREISGDGYNFGVPTMWGGTIKSIIPWSRILSKEEIVCAISTDTDASLNAWITIDNQLHKVGDQFKCIYSTEKTQIGNLVTVEARNGKSIFISVPKAGFVIYEKV